MMRILHWLRRRCSVCCCCDGTCSTSLLVVLSATDTARRQTACPAGARSNRPRVHPKSSEARPSLTSGRDSYSFQRTVLQSLCRSRPEDRRKGLYIPPVGGGWKNKELPTSFRPR